MDRSTPTFAGLIAGLVSVAAMASGCESTRTTLGAAYMQASIEGDLALSGATSSPLKERRNSIRRSMRATDDEPTPLVRLRVEKDRASFDVSGFWMNTSGEGALLAPFGDLPAGTDVRNDIGFANVKAIGRYDLLPSESFVLAPGIGVDYFRLDVESRSRVGTGFEEVENDVLVPVVDLLTGFDLGPVSLMAEASWMDADLGDADGTYWDLDGLLRVRASDRFALFGGYRWIKLDANGLADSRNYESNLEVSGWYAGGEYTFGSQRTNPTGIRRTSERAPRRLRKLN